MSRTPIPPDLIHNPYLKSEHEIRTDIIFFGKKARLVCDGDCTHAWGRSWTDPKGAKAPTDPGTYEGSDAKPLNKVHNKWCARECERSRLEER